VCAESLIGKTKEALSEGEAFVMAGDTLALSGMSADGMDDAVGAAE
jgi:hypothetical protein